MSMRQAVVIAISTSRAAKETAVELRSTGRAKAPVPTWAFLPTWTLPLPAFANFRLVLISLGTSETERGDNASRNLRVSAGSYFLSDENTIKKKRSFEAEEKRGTLNTG